MGGLNCKRQPDEICDTAISAHNSFNNNNIKTGLHVTIHCIRDYLPVHPFRVLCSLTEEGIVILDEQGFKCAFNTPLQQPSTQSITSIKYQQNNKTLPDGIEINETAYFPRNLHWVLKNQNVKRNLYLSFQILQKSERIETETNTEDLTPTLDSNNILSFPTLMNNKTECLTKLKLVGWILFKLNTSDNSIVGGRFTSRLLKPPLIRFPIKKGAALTPANKIRLEFSVE